MQKSYPHWGKRQKSNKEVAKKWLIGIHGLLPREALGTRT